MAAATLSFTDRLLALRDRLYASAAFHRAASSFPLTRPFARRRTREVFDLVAGFVYSQVLSACVKLDLFRKLAQGPMTLTQLALHCQMSTEATDRLLAAAISLRLIESRGTDERGQARYGLGVLGAPLVENEGVLAMIRHHDTLYSDLADPVALLRGQGPAPALSGFYPYTADDAPAHAGELAPDHVGNYSQLMAASQPLVAAEILDAYSFDRHHRLLDVGGGEGRFLCSVGARAPHLQLTLFDLPAVAERAKSRFATAGLAQRANAIGGNFLSDPLPTGFDIVSLVRVIHDHDEQRALTILRAIHAALPPGGTLLLAEPMAGTPGAEAMGDAYFGFYLLAMGRGRARTAAQLSALLTEAGFSAIRAVPTRIPLQVRMLVATR
ncbi:MAG: acetylserotonin O-methyltransferase [Oxalobacteraceae bacterium]|jgi:demethylspheroidene O-methyltransferase|nr:acetylserotonin O-methyltransferase [Oxalobacteraceae bacterium]